MDGRQSSSEPIEWRRGRSWVWVTNPYRIDHPVDVRLTRLNRIRDRSRDYLCGAAVTVMGGVGFPLVAVGATPLAAAATGLGAAAVAVTVASRRYGAACSAASRAYSSLTDDVGPPKIRSADLLDKRLSAQADRAMHATQAVLDSVALEQGSLGDPQMVRTEVHQMVWRILRAAVAVDRRSAALQHTDARLESLEVPTAVVADERKAATTVLDAEAKAVDAAAEELIALAARVADLDQRLLTPAARDAVAALATPISVDHGSVWAGFVLGSRIDSAHQVLDSHGATPTSLPSNHRRA